MMERPFLICMPWAVRPAIIECRMRYCAKCSMEIAVDAGNTHLVDTAGFLPICIFCGVPDLMRGDSKVAGTLIGGHMYPVGTPISELRRQVAILSVKQRRN